MSPSDFRVATYSFKKVAEYRYIRVQLAITSPLRDALHNIHVSIPVRNTREMCIVRDELV